MVDNLAWKSIYRIECDNVTGVRRARTASALNQTTVAESIELSGTGLHSGLDTRVTIHPADQDFGIVFCDSHSNVVRAQAGNVVDTSRGTTLGSGDIRIMTVEHLMAALSGMGVDNAVVEVCGGELPALDGSALAYAEAIEAVGVIRLDAPRRSIRLTEPICVRQNGSFILAVPAEKSIFNFVLNYDHPMIGCQTSSFVLEETDFAVEIAPARTFALYEEVAALLDEGLSKGGSIDNAIVIWQDHLSSDLRFPDELVRHKIMDLIGDVYLAGGRIQAEILAVKSGHALNIEFAKEVERMVVEQQDDYLLNAAG